MDMAYKAYLRTVSYAWNDCERKANAETKNHQRDDRGSRL